MTGMVKASEVACGSFLHLMDGALAQIPVTQTEADGGLQ